MAFGSLPTFRAPPLNPQPDFAQVGDGTAPSGLLAQAMPRKHGTLHGFLGFLQEALTGIPTTEHRQAAQDRALAFDERKGLLAQQLEQANAASNRTAEHDEWQARQEWEATHRPEPPAIAIARAAGLTEGSPEWRSALTAAIPGYGYTAPVMQARTDGQKEVAGYRADRAAATRAQPTYAQLHPAPHAAPRPPKPPAGFILD